MNYVPTQELRAQAWQAAERYEQTGQRKHLAAERALRDEITRRHVAGECETCGYVEAECSCRDCAAGNNVVLSNELEMRGAYLSKLDEYTARQLTPLGDALPLPREAAELTAVLRRLVPLLTVEQLHRAFGAPGDWGYDTSLGDALIAIYRAEEDV